MGPEARALPELSVDRKRWRNKAQPAADEPDSYNGNFGSGADLFTFVKVALASDRQTGSLLT